MQLYMLTSLSYGNCGSGAVSDTCEGELIEHQKGITRVTDIATSDSIF